jgi:hypothetical protein
LSDLIRTSASATVRPPVMPPVELPPLPDHLAEEAAAALGWDGIVLPPMTLLGRRVVVVAELLVDVHFDRLATGWGPVTDRLSVGTWSWPELAGRAPDSAVLISGVLAPARHWRTALTYVAPFGGLAPTAMLLPPGPARDLDCLMQADYYGAAVLASADGDLVDVVQAGRSSRLVTVCSTTTCRWVHEIVYDRVLAELASI